jgi:hypothetical protein
VESPDSFLETTKEKGNKILVESPGKLVRERLLTQGLPKDLSLRKIDSMIPRQQRQNVIAQFVARSNG